MTEHTYEQRAGDVAAIGTDAQGRRRMVGYAAVFGARAELAPGIVETIAPGAFTDSLSRGDDVRLTFNHDPSQLLARTTSRTLKLSQDSQGLRMEAMLPDTTLGRDVAELIARGDLSGASFRFKTPPDEQEWSLLPDGNELRTLKKLSLIDVTLGTYPVYPEAAVALRTRPADLDNDVMVIPVRILRRHRLYKLTQETETAPRFAARHGKDDE